MANGQFNESAGARFATCAMYSESRFGLVSRVAVHDGRLPLSDII